MWPKQSTDFNIPPQSAPNVHPINGRAQIMEQQNTSQLPWILHHQFQSYESAGSKKLLETFLYYYRAVGCTMLPSLNTLSEQQSSPTKNTEAAVTHFLDYVATNPSAIIQYKSSDIILHIASDASYLSEPRARSHTGGHYYLRSLPTDPKHSTNLPPLANSPIHTECRILKHVVTSAAEAEVGGLFHS